MSMETIVLHLTVTRKQSSDVHAKIASFPKNVLGSSCIEN